MSQKLLLTIFFVFVISGVILMFIKLSIIGENNPYELPVLPDAKELTVSTQNSNKLVNNLLGTDYLKYGWSIKYYVTNKTGNQIIAEFKANLSGEKWQTETDWEHQNALIIGKWRKDSYKVTIMILDDLDSTEINSIYKSYGISGLINNQTLVIVHEMDTKEPIH